MTAAIEGKHRSDVRSVRQQGLTVADLRVWLAFANLPDDAKLTVETVGGAPAPVRVVCVGAEWDGGTS